MLVDYFKKNKNEERTQTFKETCNPRYIYQNKLDKMAFGDFKDLTRRTASYKILRDKEFNMPKNPKYDEYQYGLVWIVYKFFDKKTSGKKVKNKLEWTSNKELAEELQKTIIKKIQEKKSTLIFYRQ